MTRAVRHLVKAGYAPRDLETYIIMGLPQQPLDEVHDTIQYANSLGVQIRLSSFSPIPGTTDYQRAIDNGLFPADADPLLTNKTVIPLERTESAYQRFQTISDSVRRLNEGVRQGSVMRVEAKYRTHAIRSELTAPSFRASNARPGIQSPPPGFRRAPE